MKRRFFKEVAILTQYANGVDVAKVWNMEITKAARPSGETWDNVLNDKMKKSDGNVNFG